jgi:hypothetical protein
LAELNDELVGTSPEPSVGLLNEAKTAATRSTPTVESRHPRTDVRIARDWCISVLFDGFSEKTRRKKIGCERSSAVVLNPD